MFAHYYLTLFHFEGKTCLCCFQIKLFLFSSSLSRGKQCGLLLRNRGNVFFLCRNDHKPNFGGLEEEEEAKAVPLPSKLSGDRPTLLFGESEGRVKGGLNSICATLSFAFVWGKRKVGQPPNSQRL